jgi:hypothetical protein
VRVLGEGESEIPLHEVGPKSLHIAILHPWSHPNLQLAEELLHIHGKRTETFLQKNATPNRFGPSILISSVHCKTLVAWQLANALQGTEYPMSPIRELMVNRRGSSISPTDNSKSFQHWKEGLAKARARVAILRSARRFSQKSDLATPMTPFSPVTNLNANLMKPPSSPDKL